MANKIARELQCKTELKLRWKLRLVCRLGSSLVYFYLPPLRKSSKDFKKFLVGTWYYIFDCFWDHFPFAHLLPYASHFHIPWWFFIKKQKNRKWIHSIVNSPPTSLSNQPSTIGRIETVEGLIFFSTKTKKREQKIQLVRIHYCHGSMKQKTRNRISSRSWQWGSNFLD